MCGREREHNLKRGYDEAVYLLGMACSCVAFLPSLGRMRMGLGPGTFSHPEVKGPHSLCGAYGLLWESLSLFPAQGALLCSVYTCTSVGSPPNTHPARPPEISGFQTPGRKCWGPSAAAQEGVHRPIAPRQLHTSSAPTTGQEGRQRPNARGALSFHNVSKAWSLQCLTVLCFPW